MLPVSVGDKLGPYQILAAIGAGGMGESVPRARYRPGRDVAVKVCRRPSLEEDRMRRFGRRPAVAALNHPNVLAIYDTGAQDGVPYLVSNCWRAIPCAKAQPRKVCPAKSSGVCAPDCRWLAAAHEKRIVHRDLAREPLPHRFRTVKTWISVWPKCPPRVPCRAGWSTATITAVTSPGS